MKKVLFSTLIVLACFVLVGCGKVPKLSNGEEAIVTMKNGKISVDTLYAELKDEALNKLIDLIDSKLLEKKYPDNKDQEEYVKSQMETQQYYYDSYMKEQYSSFLAYIQAQGFNTQEDLEDYFKLNYKRNQAVKDYAKESITEKEIKKYYQDEIFGDITTSHILVAPDYEDGASDAEIKKAENLALAKAKEIIKELNKGKDFKKLIDKYNAEKGKVSGEELPAFNKGQQTEEYEKAARALKVGKYTTTPVKDEYGYHIILKTKEDKKPALKEVKDEIISTLAEEKLDKDNYNALALIQIREDNDVKIQDSTLKNKYETYVENIKNS